jgi:two-component system, cell cycle sensor histidine kinase and response regulator CckA
MDRDDTPFSDTGSDAGLIASLLDDAHSATATIDLNPVLETDLTASGSFDLRRTNIAAFGKFLQALSVPTLLVSRSQKIKFANTAFSRLPKTAVSATGAMFSSLFPSHVESRKALMLLERVFNERRPAVRETILQIHDKRMWARMHLRTIRAAGEQMVLVQIENLTAEKQLLTIQKYRRLVNIFPLAIGEFALPRPVETGLPLETVLAHVLDARVVSGNNKFALMHGRRDIEELTGQKMGSLFPGEKKGRRIYHKWVEAGFPIQSFETKETVVRQKSQYYENTLIANVSKSRLLGFWWIKRDISEKKLIEAEMLKHQKLESVGILAGGIAHDFNNLLTGILGNISLAQGLLNKGEKAYERLASASKACMRAQELTGQLLTFSRGGEPIKKTVSVEELLTDAALFALRGSTVLCEFNVPQKLWPVEVDEGQIYQVVNNLVINAVQAMPKGGVIRVGACNVSNRQTTDTVQLKPGKHVRVTISDTGVGIPPENLRKIFDPYFTTKPTGTGLGLATCYSIIRKHGGIIGVTPNEDQGTTFTFFLPASSRVPDQTLQFHETAPSGKGRVLVMEDEEIIRDLISELLVERGYDVELAKDGEEAVMAYAAALTAGNGFDVVLMDLTIPGGMGGKEAIGKLLEKDRNAKVIVSSGYSNDPIMAEFKEHGFVGVLPKPYNPDDVVREIQRTIEGAHKDPLS